MLCENFTSGLLVYRTRDELNPDLFPYITYHSEIQEPWAEQFGGVALRGLFFDPNNEGVIVAVATMDYIYWPSWNNKRWEFDANDGTLIRHGSFIGNSFYGYSFYQGAGGELYQLQITGGAYLVTADYQLSDFIDQDTYDAISLGPFMVDRARNRIVMASSNEFRQIGVYNFTSGALIERFDLPDAVVDVCHGGGTKVYILLANNAVVGLDYVSGWYFEYVKVPYIGIGHDNRGGVRITYDKRFQRLLACWITPDAEDGASTTRIHGYRNRPVPTHVCKPIPLRRLRASEKSPVWVKAIGDLGEGLLSTATVEATVEPSRIVRTEVPLDGAGEGVTEISGVSEGSETVDVSVPTTCLL